MRRAFFILLTAVCFKVSILGQITFYTGLPADDVRFWTVEARLTEAFKRVGYDFELINMPKLRALDMANLEGDGDGHRVHNIFELQPLKTDNLIRINVPIRGGVGMSVYSLTGNDIEVNGFESLRHFNSNGYLRGINFLEKNVPNGVALNSSEQLLRLLKLSRIDTILLNEEEFKSLDLDEREGVVKIGIVGGGRYIYSYINKKYKNLAPLLEQALEDMIKDGTYDKLNFE